MKGKHTSLTTFLPALAYREALRARIRRLVHWQPLRAAQPACTAIIGVCSRLPQVLAANLRCLNEARWPELRQVIAVVDGDSAALPEGMEQRLCATYRGLNLKFLHYSNVQSRTAEKVRLPYVYSWLSWCIGISHTETDHLLLHDYDALVLGPSLADRYRAFATSKARVQGISWYKVNGVDEADHLATTFEAFFDARWLRSLKPLDLFNKLRFRNGRSIDFDTTLDAQDRLLPGNARTVVPMDLEQLVHPSQMIHQYTMFLRHPNRAQACFSIPMIPFFGYLSGIEGCIEGATRALESQGKVNVDLVGDGSRMNLSQLTVASVDWALKQMIQAMLAMKLDPDPAIYRYGKALYKAIGAAEDMVWRGDFTVRQRQWIHTSASLME
jgi:hypothetical protein